MMMEYDPSKLTSKEIWESQFYRRKRDIEKVRDLKSPILITQGDGVAHIYTEEIIPIDRGRDYLTAFQILYNVNRFNKNKQAKRNKQS